MARRTILKGPREGKLARRRHFHRRLRGERRDAHIALGLLPPGYRREQLFSRTYADAPASVGPNIRPARSKNRVDLSIIERCDGIM